MIKPFWPVLYAKPMEVLLAASLLVLGIVMLPFVYPEVLEHTPIGFETRGVVHHIWHGSLVAGGLFTLVGLFVNKPWAPRIEFAGLLILFVAIAENMIALIADETTIGGMVLSLRVAILAFIAVRCYAILAQPVVYVVKGRDG